jgi:hypothetical protein
MVSRGVRHDPARQRVLGQRQNQVRGAANLERSAALEVLALEEHAHARFGVESARSKHRRPPRQRPDSLRRRAHIVRLDCQLHGFHPHNRPFITFRATGETIRGILPL